MVDELGNAKGLYLSIPCHSPQPQTHKKPSKSLNLNGLSKLCRPLSWALSGERGSISVMIALLILQLYLHLLKNPNI